MIVRLHRLCKVNGNTTFISLRGHLDLPVAVPRTALARLARRPAPLPLLLPLPMLLPLLDLDMGGAGVSACLFERLSRGGASLCACVVAGSLRHPEVEENK